MDDVDQLVRQINCSSLVLVLGGSDTGKTTLVRYLHERLGGDVIDADLGQASIGPPAVISLGTFTNGAQAGYFVGDNSPAGHFLQVLTGCHHMAMKAQRPCVIDTDGYIDDGAARAIKSELINLIRPDLIVLLQRAHELNYYKMYERKGITVIEHPVRHSESRSREQRIQTREERFRDYFSQAGLQRWKLREMAFECSELGDGEPLDTTTLIKSLRCEVTTAGKREEKPR